MKNAIASFLAATLAATVLALTCAAAAGAEEGYSIEGRTLVIHEGVEALGTFGCDDSDTEITYPHQLVLNEENFDFGRGLSYLNAVQLPSTLKRIGSGELDMLGAKRVDIPEGVVEMGCCLDGSLVETISLPTTLTNANFSAIFSDMDRLREIIVPSDHPTLQTIDGVLFSKDGTALIWYPRQKPETHYDVPAGVAVIGQSAFSKCASLQSVSLPMGVTDIGSSAFYGCASLQSVAVPLSVKSVGDYAFAECTRLAQLSLPAGVAVGECIAQWTPLTEHPEWNAYPVSPQDDLALEYNAPSVKERRAILRTDNARTKETIAVRCLQSNDDAAYYPNVSFTVKQYECGSMVSVVGEVGDEYRIVFREDNAEAGETGFVNKNRVEFFHAPLFDIADVAPINDRVRSHEPCMQPMGEGGKLTSDDAYRVNGAPYTFLSYIEQVGPWIQAACVTVQSNELGEDCLEANWFSYFHVSDLTITRVRTGDARTFGIVCNPDIRDRTNLRATPDKGASRLGRYFSGAQAEILGEQDGWYRVRMDNGVEGFMMKEFLRIVPQEE